MVCLSSCDKTPPAHLMAAGRFNVPTILVVCGYQPSGQYEGKHVDIEDVFIGSVQAMFGKLSKEALAGMCDHAITGPGVCAGMPPITALIKDLSSTIRRAVIMEPLEYPTAIYFLILSDFKRPMSPKRVHW